MEPVAKAALQVGKRLVVVLASRVIKGKCLWMFSVVDQYSD